MSELLASLTAAWRVSFIRYGLIVSVTAVLVFPILSSRYIQPQFSDLLISIVEHQAVLSATHMQHMLHLGERPVTADTVDDAFLHHMEMLENDYGLWKAKLFDAAGLTIYSTESKDVGARNSHDYFHSKVAAGETYSHLVMKRSQTLEGEIVPRDVLEVYVPLMSDGRFLGAFELYYDITNDYRALIALIRHGSTLSLSLSLLILILLLIVALRAGSDVRQRKRIQSQLADEELRLRTMTQSAQDAIIMIDDAGRVCSWNRSAERIFGYREKEILGKPMHQLIAPDQAGQTGGLGLETFAEDGAGFMADKTLEFKARHREGQEFPLELSIAPMRLQGKWHAVAIGRDITRRKATEEQLRLSHQVMASAGEGILITDSEQRILSVNHAFTQITGYEAEEVMGERPGFLRSGRHPADFYDKIWAELERRGAWNGEIWNRRKDGSVYVEWLGISAVRKEDGTIANYVGIFSDMTHRKEQEAELERLAFFDPLTGLANRLLLKDRLEQACSHARRGRSKVAVLFMDLDRFKQVNDEYGHETGDCLLQGVADRLTGLVRGHDTLARIGGDEFVVVIRDVATPEGASSVAGKIIRSLEQPFALNGDRCSVGVSIGIALYPDDAGETPELIRLADQAMYRAKKLGRNQYCFHGESQRARLSEAH